MNSGELRQKTRRELLQLAQTKNIPNYHAMSCRELEASLSSIQMQRPPERESHPCPGSTTPPDPLPPIPQRYGKTRIVLLVRDPNWLFTYWEVEKPHLERAEKEAGFGSRRILRVYNTSGEFFDETLTDDAESWYLETGKPGQSFFVEIGLLSQDGRFIPIARSNTVTAPPADISPIIDEAWLTVDELYKMAASVPEASSSAELQEAVRQRLEWEGGSGAVSSISSPVKVEVEDGFWLNLNTELILYGATDPRATVTVSGLKVPLNERGEFSLRFALPDGTLTLPVVAKDATGSKEIIITPRVMRTTDKEEKL